MLFGYGLFGVLYFGCSHLAQPFRCTSAFGNQSFLTPYHRPLPIWAHIRPFAASLLSLPKTAIFLPN